MANVSILDLPPELHHYIFDYIDTRTLVQSLRCVCRSLCTSVNNYDRFKLDCSVNSTSDIKITARIIHPQNVISLTVFDDFEKLYYSDKFFSAFYMYVFTQLRSLTLREVNDLERFLPLIDNNKHLTSLSVEFRGRPNNKAFELLSNIFTCFNLRSLNLNNIDNAIEHITWPPQCKLKCLFIGSCTYNEYHLILRQSPYLKTISLKNCIMNHQSETTSASILPKCYSQVISLTIHDCKLTMEDFDSILSLTPALTYLKVISSTSSFSSVFDGSCLERCLIATVPFLNKFEFMFSCDFIQNLGIPTLESIIATFQTSFWLVDKHWFVICDYLLGRPKKLRIYTTPICMTNFNQPMRFEVSSKDGVSRFTERSLSAVADGVEKEDLIKLDFSKETLGKVGLTYLANVLRHNQLIRMLYLGDQGIGSNNVQILADGLRNNHTLFILHLGGNQIQKHGLKALADALQNNETLTELSLGYNGIEDIDTQYLADALRINKTLNTLSLVGNHVGVIGAQHLADTLRVNNTLTALYLDVNEIGDVGIQHLADVLQTNQTLTTLSLIKNQIGIAGAQHLADTLRLNRTLTTLFLGGNRIGMTGATYLSDALENNKSLTTMGIEFNQASDQMIGHINKLLYRNAQFKVEN